MKCEVQCIATDIVTCTATAATCSLALILLSSRRMSGSMIQWSMRRLPLRCWRHSWLECWKKYMPSWMLKRNNSSSRNPIRMMRRGFTCNLKKERPRVESVEIPDDVMNFMHEMAAPLPLANCSGIEQQQELLAANRQQIEEEAEIPDDVVHFVLEMQGSPDMHLEVTDDEGDVLQARVHVLDKMDEAVINWSQVGKEVTPTPSPISVARIPGATPHVSAREVKRRHASPCKAPLVATRDAAAAAPQQQSHLPDLDVCTGHRNVVPLHPGLGARCLLTFFI